MSNDKLDPNKVRGYISAGEIDLLISLAGKVPADGTMVNIGVEYGRSVVCMHVANETADIVGIDIKLERWQHGKTLKNVRLIEANSQEYVNEWDGPIDFIFVDGDHGYNGVTKDTKWADHIVVGGYIAFHDCYNWPPAKPKTIHFRCPGVNKAVEEWFRKTLSVTVVPPEPPRYGDWEELEPVDSIRIFKRIA